MYELAIYIAARPPDKDPVTDIDTPSAPTEAIHYARAVGITAGYVLGGSGLVSDDAVKAILGTNSVR